MKSTIYICPYFGKLPEGHIELWLNSCEPPTINWLILTDDKSTNISCPPNINTGNVRIFP